MLHSWQFAADGIWEQALSIGAARPVDRERVALWVHNAAQDVAFEAVFAADGVPTSLVGMRIAGLSKSEQVQRIDVLLARSGAICTEADFVAAAADAFPQFRLFASPLAALNLGILSQWYSIGPATLWQPGCAAPMPLAEVAGMAPRLVETTRNPAAVEAWFTTPVEHWRKLYVSRSGVDGYRIDPAKYEAALKIVDNWAIKP